MLLGAKTEEEMAAESAPKTGKKVTKVKEKKSKTAPTNAKNITPKSVESAATNDNDCKFRFV